MMALSLNQTLCDLDRIPALLESIRIRTTIESKWCLQAEELATKATHVLEKLAVHYEDAENEEDTYEEPDDFRLLKLLDKHLDLLMESKDLQELFNEKLDIEIVELLLSFDQVDDPSADNNKAIRIASQNGYDALVDRLLQDGTGRVDPSAEDNYAIRVASYSGHIAVVDRLLQDGRVDPSAQDNYAIKLASKNGHVAVVDRLLQDGRVDPSAQDNYAIKLASKNGHVAVVDRLLQDGTGRIDPSAYNNYAIQWASQNGHKAIKMVTSG